MYNLFVHTSKSRDESFIWNLTKKMKTWWKKAKITLLFFKMVSNFKGGVFFLALKWTFWTKKVWGVCSCHMTTRVGAFHRKVYGKHFHNLLYSHTTSRKVSTGLRRPDSNFLTPQKTWKSAWFINILHSLVRIPY